MTQPSALDRQVGGSHYKDQAVQPWEALDAWLTPEQQVGYYLGSAIAYLARYNAAGVGKGGAQDIEKAGHYLDKLVETIKSSDVQTTTKEVIEKDTGSAGQRRWFVGTEVSTSTDKETK